MKKIIILSALFIANLQTAFCQMGALKGSGKVVTRTFAFKNFDSIHLKDFDGKIEVEVGKGYSIKIAIDDNLEPLLLVNENNKTLSIALDKNENNRRYVENSNIKITIKVPQLSKVLQTGNSDTYLSGVESKILIVKISGNGNLVVAGNTENINIKKSGNGNVEAGKLNAKNANIFSTGNGDIKVNVSDNFMATRSGNGNIKNIGKAKASANSQKIGNSEIISN